MSLIETLLRTSPLLRQIEDCDHTIEYCTEEYIPDSGPKPLDLSLLIVNGLGQFSVMLIPTLWGVGSSAAGLPFTWFLRLLSPSWLLYFVYIMVQENKDDVPMAEYVILSLEHYGLTITPILILWYTINIMKYAFSYGTSVWTGVIIYMGLSGWLYSQMMKRSMKAIKFVDPSWDKHQGKYLFPSVIYELGLIEEETVEEEAEALFAMSY